MRQLLIYIGLWIAKLGGWKAQALTPIPIKSVCQGYHLDISDELLDTAKLLVAQVEDKFQGVSGEFKRAQALRALLNNHTKFSERQCSQAIEVAIDHIL